MVALRWTIRGLGLAQTVILARLLTPADFGLCAMAMLIVGVVEILFDTGQAYALIREPNPTREHFDTAWTIGIGAGWTMTVVLIVVAPLAPLYFHDERTVPLIQVFALRAAIGSFENIGVVNFRKNLEFRREFGYEVAKKIFSFVLSVAAGFILRNYWALAVGLVGGRLLLVVYSYVIHPYRPRLSVAKLGELWSYSSWLTLNSIGQFLDDRSDEVVVGGAAGTAAMGNYNIAADISTAPTSEVLTPIGRTLFPVYATMVTDVEKLKTSYLEVLSIVAIIAFSMSGGVASIANDMVLVVLGPRWANAVPLVAWLALAYTGFGLSYNAVSVLNVIGAVRQSARLIWLRVLVLVPAVAVAGFVSGTQAVAITRAAVMIGYLPVVFLILMRNLPISAAEILSRLWRPAIAGAAMFIIVRYFHDPSIAIPAERLLADTATGVLSFIAALYGLWYLAGQPEGSELLVLREIERLILLRLEPRPDAPIKSPWGETVLRRCLLYVLRSMGVFIIARRLTKGRLRIVCYHGVSLSSEHEFHGELFVTPATFRKRMNALSQLRATVLPLREALDRLDSGRPLPECPVVITIDDGWHSTYRHAARIALEHRFPVTIYVTTYYVENQVPVFNLLVLYILSKGSHLGFEKKGSYFSLRYDPDKWRFARRLIEFGESECTLEERQRFLALLARIYRVDLTEIVSSGSFRLMSKEEIGELAGSGIDVQLHTHRHRVPRQDHELLKREIADNRAVLQRLVSNPLEHFCYPSGDYHPGDDEWLRELGIKSAVTCESGLNDRDTPRFALRRYLDNELMSQIEFEAEICGMFELLRQARDRLRRLLGRAPAPALSR